MMWFFDGQHIELACYIVSKDTENELILTGENKKIDAMLYALLESDKRNHPESVEGDIKDSGVFDKEMEEICVAIGNQLDLQKLKINLIAPGEYD